MLGVQGAGVGQVGGSFETGSLVRSCKGATIADRMIVGCPRNWRISV
jgi:hypothetical protein